jgi:hypothetical protein
MNLLIRGGTPCRRSTRRTFGDVRAVFDALAPPFSVLRKVAAIGAAAGSWATNAAT